MNRAPFLVWACFSYELNAVADWVFCALEPLKALQLGGDNYRGRSLTFVLAGGEESQAA
ncbi:hypothetical protein VSR68_17725 [Paraburkholderia phymatum]|uniref:hypothetical protein n=1 Tax=Paraburkholderia phymatum TaxID=148447 RepID=UPI0031723E12